jgi:hypothetical protein
MKKYFVLSVALLSKVVIFGQEPNKWKLDGMQFNFGGVMNSKLPVNNMSIYSAYIYSADSTILLNEFTPSVRTNIQMTPSVGLNIIWSNLAKNSNRRLGLYFNRKGISSFGIYNNAVFDTVSGEWSNQYNEVQVSHTSPSLTIDYSWMKQFSLLNNNLYFNVGLGGYAGSTYRNKLVLYTYTDQFAPIETISSVSNNFRSFAFNGGIYGVIGLDYCLTPNNTANKKWYLTYESRFGGDYYTQSFPLQGFSYQNTHLVGVKYKFSKKEK